MIEEERIQPLNDADARDGRYVLYWMQASQRAQYNHALAHAIEQANEREMPVVVAFGLMDDYPEASERHYAFMLEGLSETREALAAMGVRMIVRHGHPADAAKALAGDAALVVCDRGYLRHQRQWRDDVAQRVGCACVQVESDVVVPAETVTDKEEYAARTIRPKIHRELDRFLVTLETPKVERASTNLKLDIDGEEIHVRDVDAALASLAIDRDVPRVSTYRGGRSQVDRLLDDFLDEKLTSYDDGRNEPSEDWVSHMSPYLHFGQVSPLELALRVRDAKAPKSARDAYVEELVVRRELAINFVLFNPKYDSFESLPDWARETLREHENDKRQHVYTRKQLEQAATHDDYWNAAQLEMVITGKMHNYMRMYWGKKILEWTNDPAAAFHTALYLNNKYELDGRDPNSWANIAWLFGKHDRPWQERAIFGKVRYMNDRGLERKTDIRAYVEQVRSLQDDG